MCKNKNIEICKKLFSTCRPAAFRAVKAGRCAAAVKPTDLPERTTAVSARGAYAAWTTTVPGERTPPARPPPCPPSQTLPPPLCCLLF